MILNVDKIKILVYRHSGIIHNHNEKNIFSEKQMKMEITMKSKISHT